MTVARRYPPEINFAKEFSYDSYWRVKRPGTMGALSTFQRRRAQIVSQYIEEGSRVLDVGCGDGAILSFLRDTRNIQATGVDTSPFALAHVATRGIDTVTADCNDIASLKALPEADYILLLEVLEHLPRPEEVLQALSPKCKKAFILSVPNSGYFSHRLRLLGGHFPLQWIAHPGEHLRFWTLADFRWWISALGFKLEALQCYEGVPIFNKLWPSMFAAGIVAKITTP